MGEGNEAYVSKVGVSVGGGCAGKGTLGFGVGVSIFLRGDGCCGGSGVCQGCVQVRWRRVVWCGVCCNYGLSHGIEKQATSTGSEVIGESEYLEGCCEDGVGVVPGGGEG